MGGSYKESQASTHIRLKASETPTNKAELMFTMHDKSMNVSIRLQKMIIHGGKKVNIKFLVTNNKIKAKLNSSRYEAEPDELYDGFLRRFSLCGIN